MPPESYFEVSLLPFSLLFHFTETMTLQGIMYYATYIQGYSRVINGLTNIQTQPVIHFHRLRGEFIFI
jgi:hypothetical protein